MEKLLEVNQKYLSSDLGRMKDFLKKKIVKEYIVIAFSDIGDFLDLESTKNIRFKQLSKIPKDSFKAIASIYSVSKKNGSTLKIKMHEKKNALAFLASYCNLIKDQKSELELEKILNLSDEKIRMLMKMLGESK